MASTSFTLRCVNTECKTLHSVFIERSAIDSHRCKKCGGATQVVIKKAPPVSIRHGMKESTLNNGDYREDLARFPNDPEARVDGPRALKKLIEKRKREGCTFQKISDMAPDGAGADKSNESLIREALDEAKRDVHNGNEGND